MGYKKVTSQHKGTLRIRSEPDKNARICGSLSYGESITVDAVKVQSKTGTEYYRVLGYGYVEAAYMKDGESGVEINNDEINKVVKMAETAAKKAEPAAKTCEGLAAGINTMTDSVTGKVCELGMTDGIMTVKEA